MCSEWQSSTSADETERVDSAIMYVENELDYDVALSNL